MPVLTLLVAGVAVGSFLSALVSLFVYFADERLHQVVFWLMGGLCRRYLALRGDGPCPTQSLGWPWWASMPGS